MAGRIAYTGNIVRDGLVLLLDAAKKDSYLGSGTVWNDISGNRNNGTLTNGPTFNNSNNGSIVFDGGDDYNLLPINFISYPSLTTFTISLWFKSAQSTGGTLFAQQDSLDISATAGYVPVVYLRSDGLLRVEPFWTNSVNNNILSTTSLNDNVWHNVTTTYNSGVNQLYIDGEYVTQRTGLSLFSYTTNYYYFIGAGRAAGRSLGTNYFSGNISAFCFYNKALSAAEVSQNFNALRGRYGI